MSIMLLQGAVEQGFIYALVALALYLSYRTLDIADLTTDGTFVLGCAVSASLCSLGQPVLGLVGGFGAGLLAGFVTAFLHTRLKIQAILAGIITMTGLYTVNLWVMGGRADLPLLKVDTIFTYTQSLLGESYGKLITVALITCVVGVLLALFLKTQLGLSIRATGDNRDMVRASSINPTFTITIGLCIANALTGLSGAVVGQAQKTADINAGTGVVVIGLACLIIGETIVGRGAMFRGAVAVIVGSILYRFIYAIVLYTKVVPIDCLKLVTAIVVGLAIAAPTLKSWAAFQARKRKALAARKGEK